MGRTGFISRVRGRAIAVSSQCAQEPDVSCQLDVERSSSFRLFHEVTKVTRKTNLLIYQSPKAVQWDDV